MTICIESLKKISLEENEYLLIEYGKGLETGELPILVHALREVFGGNFKKVIYAPRDTLRLTKVAMPNEKRTDH